jgi:cell division protein FtsB
MSTVNVQTVVQILSAKVAALTTENAILQAQNAELEERIRKLEGQAGGLVNKEKSAVQPAE